MKKIYHLEKRSAYCPPEINVLFIETEQCFAMSSDEGDERLLYDELEAF